VTNTLGKVISMKAALIARQM